MVSYATEGVHEDVGEQKRKNFDNRISDTTSEIGLVRKNIISKLYMIRSLTRKLRSSELTLREKIVAIVSEQGVKVAAALTGIGTTITSVVEDLTSAVADTAISVTGGGVPPNPPTSDPSKQQGILNNLKNSLGWLTDKAPAALAEIIGSII